MNNRIRMRAIIKEVEKRELKLLSRNLNDYVLYNPEMFSLTISATAFETMLKQILEGFFAHNVTEELKRFGSITKESMRYVLDLHKEARRVLNLIYLDYSNNIIKLANEGVN